MKGKLTVLKNKTLEDTFKHRTCLYVLRVKYKEKDLIKIGVTNNILTRVKSISSEIKVPEENLETLLIYEHPKILVLEQALLNILKKRVFYGIKNKYEYIEENNFNIYFKDKLIKAFKLISQDKKYINNILDNFNFIYNGTKYVTFNSSEKPSIIPCIDKVLEEDNLRYIKHCTITKRFIHRDCLYEIYENKSKDTITLYKNGKTFKKGTLSDFPENLKKKANLIRPLIMKFKREMTKYQHECYRKLFSFL